MHVCDMIRERLTMAFAPATLEIVDESDQHLGHAGWDAAGETHFRITIHAPSFAKMSRVDRHRAVYAALDTDLTGRIHAIALHITG